MDSLTGGLHANLVAFFFDISYGFACCQVPEADQYFGFRIAGRKKKTVQAMTLVSKSYLKISFLLHFDVAVACTSLGHICRHLLFNAIFEMEYDEIIDKNIEKNKLK